MGGKLYTATTHNKTAWDLELIYHQCHTYGDGFEIDEIRDLLVIFLFSLIQTDADEMGVHKLCPHRAKDLISPVLHQGQLSGIEYHTHLQNIIAYHVTMIWVAFLEVITQKTHVHL